MRVAAILYPLLFSLCLGSFEVARAGIAQAQVPQGNTAGKEAARKHFRLGVLLFRDRDYLGALAEFEAAYVDHESAQTLQNIALCQAKLFRYANAMASLETLKQKFWSSLPEVDQQAAEAAMRDLAQLVATLTITITPPDASVTINGRAVSREAMSSPIRVSSGEHRITAAAPAYASMEKTVTVAGGESINVTMTLIHDMGDVSIRAVDPDASISVDGNPAAVGEWSGLLHPGAHWMTVTKDGRVSRVVPFTVRAGERLHLGAPLGPLVQRSPKIATGAGEPKPAQAPQPSAPRPRGWYGLFSASILAALNSPSKFEPSSMVDRTGASFGGRVGYRFWENVGGEALLDIGSQCLEGTVNDPKQGGLPIAADFDLRSTRIGGNVRLLTGGRVARLSGAFGVGAVRHGFSLGAHEGSGTNSYFTLELGGQFNVGRVLLEAVVVSYLEGTANAKLDGERLYHGAAVLPQVGIGFRAGYGQWGQW